MIASCNASSKGVTRANRRIPRLRKSSASASVALVAGMPVSRAIASQSRMSWAGPSQLPAVPFQQIA